MTTFMKFTKEQLLEAKTKKGAGFANTKGLNATSNKPQD